MKTYLFTLLVLAANATVQQVYGQAALLTSISTPTVTTEKNHEVTKSAMGFQSAAFPASKTGVIKVIFEDPTGNGACIIIRDKNGRTVQSMDFLHTKQYMGNFDLSPLPDGEYTLAIVALSKKGFNKQTYLHTFRVQSTIIRKIRPVNKEVEKSLFTPRHFQVRR